MEWLISSPDEFQTVLKVLEKEIFNHKIILLYGEMGVGKTTFTKQLATFLGSKDVTSSPTFSIIQSYLLPDEKLLYHVDLYRLRTVEELLDIGFEEYLYSENWVVIEWPNLAEELLPEKVLCFQLEWISETQRKIILL